MDEKLIAEYMRINYLNSNISNLIINHGLRESCPYYGKKAMFCQRPVLSAHFHSPIVEKSLYFNLRLSPGAKVEGIYGIMNKRIARPLSCYLKLCKGSE